MGCTAQSVSNLFELHAIYYVFHAKCHYGQALGDCIIVSEIKSNGRENK